MYNNKDLQAKHEFAFESCRKKHFCRFLPFFLLFINIGQCAFQISNYKNNVRNTNFVLILRNSLQNNLESHLDLQKKETLVEERLMQLPPFFQI